MRTERLTPKGFDVQDPRLDMRRAALLAQWGQSDAGSQPTDASVDDTRPAEKPDDEPEAAGVGAAAKWPSS